jgi:hypothetical protein
MVGFIGEHFGPQATVVICGALSLGCAMLLLTRLNLIRIAQESATDTV